MGLELGLSVVVGFLIGSWLDGWLDTKPWFLLVFGVSGIIEVTGVFFVWSKEFKLILTRNTIHRLHPEIKLLTAT